MSGSRAWLAGCLWLIGLCSACGAVAPRLPLDAQRAVNRDTMRVLRTQSIDLYYPEKLAPQARAFAERAEGCIEPLRRRILTRSKEGLSARRIEIIFPDLPYNNAFVHPPANGDFFALIPSYWSFDGTSETGLVPEPGFIACHELTHYIQAQQTLRSLGLYDKLFGYLITPQDGLDSWFWEGVAVYYEGALQPGIGRPAWPAWDGMFHAAVAGRHLTGGDLNQLNRKLHWGNNYLYGSHFIDYLVRTYGEFKLWQLIQRQGESFFFPVIVNQRFRRVYGKKLSHLLDDFGAYLEQNYPVRARPDNQRVVRALGMNARYARAADGSEAIVDHAMDLPPTLTVYAPDGSVKYSARLTEVLPRRKLVSPDARELSGLRFSRDGKKLYFVAVDQGTVFQETRLLELDLETRTLKRLAKNLGGIGGDISPDGRSYLFVQTSGRGHALATFDLDTGQTRELARMPARTYLSSVTYSPDGRQIVASLADGTYSIALFDAVTGERIRTITDPAGPLSDATFIDDDQLLMLAKVDARFQIFSYRLSTGTATRLSDAPYLAFSPRVSGHTVRFLNREGYGYTLDEVRLPVAPSLEPAPVSDRALTVTPGVAPPPRATARTLHIVSDQPYSVFPRLLIPSVRQPLLGASTLSGNNSVGFYLGGTDALGKHRWGGSAGVQWNTGLASGTFGYLNSQLAPVQLMINGSQSAYDDQSTVKDPDGGHHIEHDRRRQRDLTFTSQVSLRTSQLAFLLHATNDFRKDEHNSIFRDRTMSGGTLAFAHQALESTAMSGPRRGYLSSLAGSYFPASLGTLSSNVGDLRGALQIYSPLPLSRRHTLQLGLRGRQIVSDGSAGRLLEIGGTQGVSSLYTHPDEPKPDDLTPGVAPNRRFRETLRGFETLPFTAKQIGIIDLTYRYPLIIDRGTATSFAILPSLFMRQLDLELFASGAADTVHHLQTSGHLAAGGALSATFYWWVIPVVLRYQLSERFTDLRGLQHVIALGTPLGL